MIIGDESIPVGVSSLHYEWDTIESACRIAHEELGVDIVEFSHKGREVPLKSFEWEDLPEIRSVRGKYGGKISFSLHVWFDIPGEGGSSSVEKLGKAAEFASESGAPDVVVHMGKHPEREKGMEILKESLLKALPSFEKAGAVLSLENHYPYDYKGLNELGGVPEDFLEIFDAVKSPNLGFCLDYGHSHMCGNTDDFISALSPELRYTHLADNMGDEDRHLAFGEGAVDWADALEKTLEAGFRGPFIVEYPASPETVSRFKELLREILLRRGRGRDNI